MDSEEKQKIASEFLSDLERLLSRNGWSIFTETPFCLWAEGEAIATVQHEDGGDGSTHEIVELDPEW